MIIQYKSMSEHHQELTLELCGCKVEENLQKGRDQKAQAKETQTNLLQQKMEDMEENTQKRFAVIADRVKVAQACEQLALEKKQQADVVRQQEQEDAKQIVNERAKELAERQDLIQQLKVRYV